MFSKPLQRKEAEQQASGEQGAVGEPCIQKESTQMKSEGSVGTI